MKPVLVFDWNGTLLDDAQALLQTTNSILDRVGRERIDMKTFREQCDVPLSRLYRNLGMSQDEITAVERDGSAVFHDTYEPLAGQAGLRDGARRVLKLAHQQAALSIIVSNHVVAPLRSQLRRLGIHNYIKDVLAFESRFTQYKSMSKGDRLGLYMQKNKLDPASTFIIGDMPVETEIARNLRLTSVSITGGFVSESRLRAAKPDYTINNHNELVSILKRHGFFLDV